MVFSRILISKNSDTLATYHTSYSNFCCQLMAFLPFTCAQPVMPGRTSCRRRWRSLYRGNYCTNFCQPFCILQEFFLCIFFDGNGLELHHTKSPFVFTWPSLEKEGFAAVGNSKRPVTKSKSGEAIMSLKKLRRKSRRGLKKANIHSYLENLELIISANSLHNIDLSYLVSANLLAFWAIAIVLSGFSFK